MKGVTLIETLIGIAILVIIAVSLYQGFSVLFDILSTSKIKLAASTLANEQMEIIRNMAYRNVGTIGGIPSGFIPQLETKSKDGFNFDIQTTVRNIDDPFDGTLGGNPNDLSPADYKLVELTLTCSFCKGTPIFRFTGRAAPKALETASVNGALFVQAIDANGQPVSGASVQVINDKVTPAININDTTDSTGFLKIVDVPPAVQSYRITVSKNGYSADRTYATSISNPNPVKPDATVALQTITQATFAIDRVGQINLASVTETCSPVANVDAALSGAKLIGTNPDILKFSQNYSTGASGAVTASNLEWDNYSAAISSPTHMLSGTIPNLPINLLPGAAQDFRAVMQTQNPRALLVTVKDAVSQLPLSGASVALSAGSYNNTLVTGRGFLRQTDWSGGAGQNLFVDATKYFEQDGNIDEINPAGELKLKLVATSTYAASGWLTSSAFDTGATSTFYNLIFQPQSQPPEVGPDALKFQLATATTSTPGAWNYLGPDGTPNSYYTTANANISTVHNGDRFLRYQAYLNTASTSFTPNASDLAVTFASQCVPPGQVFFGGLAPNTYNLSVSKTGYATDNSSATVNLNWQEVVIQPNPL